MPFLVDMRAAGPHLGGKAHSLAWLAEHGLHIPSGFAVTDALFRALCPSAPDFERLDEVALASLDRARARLMQETWPAGFLDELQGRLAGIRAPSYAVRSSFACEDLPGQLAPGVYESCTDVLSPDVEMAIRKVLCSALAPGAVAYAMAHGQRPARDPVAVLVHAYFAGEAEGSAAFAHERMSVPLVAVRRGQLPVEARASLGRTLTALADARGPVEVEWVLAEGRVIYLQARPFQPPVPPVSWLGFAALGDQSTSSAAWRWDAAHNPLPLSPAQAGLVDLVDGACAVGIRQRVLGGYLFYTRDHATLPPPIAAEDAGDFFASLRSEVEAHLAGLGAQPDLEKALALFVYAYERIFGVLQPALRQAHESLRVFLETHAKVGLALLPALRAGVLSMASQRRERAARISSGGIQVERARADYLALFGDEAPVWDVSEPTYAETPDTFLRESIRHTPEIAPLDWREASARVEAALAPHLRERWRHLLGTARAAVSLGEADDWLYARTQAAVRRALLAVGGRLHHATRLRAIEDVFFLPLSLVRRVAAGGEAAVDLVTRAAEGREAWMHARGHPPPSPVAADGKGVRGAGTGGRAVGRLLWHRPGSHARGARDAVLAATTLLPTELPLLDAIAIVSETGGPLDHVAAQARERGIPAVVGALGASAVFSDGDMVLVDGDAGLVVRLAEDPAEGSGGPQAGVRSD